MFMDPTAFDLLLQGDLGTRVAWMRSHRCPCAEDGAAAAACLVCSGSGVYWDAPSQPFRVGATGLSQRDLGRLTTKFGDGLVGDGQLSIPAGALCYGQVRSGDRFLAVDATDMAEWVVSKRTPVRLPVGAQVLTVMGLVSGRAVPVPMPAPDADGRIRTVAPITIRMRVPRLFEVIEDAGHIRSWQAGLPQRWSVRRIDVTVR